MGTTLESFTALDAALASGPLGGRSAPLDQVGRGSGCPALLGYVMVRLLTRVARGSGHSPAFTCYRCRGR